MADERRKLIGFGVTIAGAAAIGGGWALESSQPYLSTLLQNTGVVLFLVLPLLWIERVLERRAVAAEERTSAEIGEVRREVADVDAALGDLRAQTAQRFEARRHEDDEDVKAARAEVSFENVRQLFDRAQELEGLSRHGVRVPLPHLWDRLKFSRRDLHETDGPATPTIWVDVEGISGESLGVCVIWQPGVSAPGLLEALAQSWQKQGSYPGNEILDAEHIFGWLIKTLELVIDKRRNDRGEEPPSGMIELLSAHWALTDFGLEHVTEPPYPIKRDDILRDPTMRREHMLEKTWLAEPEQFRADFQAAERFFGGLKQRQPPRHPLQPRVR